MKVLIIEDDKVLSDTIKQCISKLYGTNQAFDGYERIHDGKRIYI